jgi:hypothetical protein
VSRSGFLRIEVLQESLACQSRLSNAQSARTRCHCIVDFTFVADLVFTESAFLQSIPFLCIPILPVCPV